MCDSQQVQVGDLIAIKSARTSEFGGRSLNAADDHAQLFKESEIQNKELNRIKSWYQKLQAQGSVQQTFAGFEALTVKPQSRNDAQNSMYKNEMDKQNKASNLNLICEINESLQEANDVDKYHFFFLNGYISRIKNDDRIFYPACKSENCRRKVIEEGGAYRCEHCNKTFMDYNPTFMITAVISDFTESINVNFAREHGASLMGMSAQ